jgi:hypothetical protein
MIWLTTGCHSYLAHHPEAFAALYLINAWYCPENPGHHRR